MVSPIPFWSPPPRARHFAQRHPQLRGAMACLVAALAVFEAVAASNSPSSPPGLVPDFTPGVRPLVPLPAACPQPPCTWEHTYGGALSDKAYGVARLPDGDVIMVGHTRSAFNLSDDVQVLRLDPAGGLRWRREFGGRGTDRAYAVAVAADGGALVAGHTRSQGRGGSDVWLLRLDAQGQLQWQRTFGGNGNDRARTVIATLDGGSLVGGFTRSRGDRAGDAWLLRLDAQGELLWERTFGGAGDDGLYHLALLADGDVAAVGHRARLGVDDRPQFDLWALRLDPKGAVRWSRTVNHSAFDAATGVAPTADGGLVVIGLTSPRLGKSDVLAVRFDPEGKVVWQRTFGGEGSDTAWAVATLPAGGYVIAAATASRGHGSSDAWLMGIDEAGRLRWERLYGGALWDRPTAAAADGAGILMAGYTTTRGAGQEDMWLLRLDGLGKLSTAP